MIRNEAEGRECYACNVGRVLRPGITAVGNRQRLPVIATGEGRMGMWAQNCVAQTKLTSPCNMRILKYVHIRFCAKTM